MFRRAMSKALTATMAIAASALALTPASAGAATTGDVMTTASTASATPATPTIRAVHFSNIGPNMRIEVDGSGFGTPAIGLPYVGDVGNFVFSDTSRNESWGQGNDWGLQYTSWTSTRIVVNGLNEWQTGQLVPGDQVSISVSNQAGGQAATWNRTLGSSPAPAPVAGEPNPVIQDVYFSDIGAKLKIVVTGAGFGAPTIGMPYSGDVGNFVFSDTSRNESWGQGNDWGLDYAAWGDQRIAVNGLGEWQSGQLVPGDQLSVSVSNAKSGEYYTWSGTLHSSPAPTGPAPAPAPKKVLTLTSATVAAGGNQTATVAIKPGESAVLVVDYPNGSQKVLGPTVAGGSGRVSFKWEVPSTVHGLVHVTLDTDGALTRGSFMVN